jgi:hypothetical protein
MKTFLSILLIVLICSCKKNEKETKMKYSNRVDLFGFNFKNEEVISIEILEIEHPMLGGVIDSVKLSNQLKNDFLNELDSLKEKGLLKCGSKHIIRLIMSKDTLRLKVCGDLVSNRKDDFYFESSKKNFLLKYL